MNRISDLSEKERKIRLTTRRVETINKLSEYESILRSYEKFYFIEMSKSSDCLDHNEESCDKTSEECGCDHSRYSKLESKLGKIVEERKFVKESLKTLNNKFNQL